MLNADALQIMNAVMSLLDVAEVGIPYLGETLGLCTHARSRAEEGGAAIVVIACLALLVTTQHARCCRAAPATLGKK